MNRARFLAAVALPLALAGCGSDEAEPRAQWVVTFATDAPIPLFGDRLLVEVLGPDGELACETCRRLLDASRIERFPISFGVRRFPDTVRVRARLYRSVNVGPDGLPTGTALIDALGVLSPAQEFAEVWLPLDADCFDVPADPVVGTTCDPSTRQPIAASELERRPGQLPEAGSWAPAQPSACPEQPPPGMACIPGGAFLLGSPLALQGDIWRMTPERVVQLSPFAIDIEETPLSVVVPMILNDQVEGAPVMKGELVPFCTFTGLDDPSTDPLPVNCIDYELAEAICAVQGKRLPTEAEWEYVASNGAADDDYPWGNDRDVCSHAYIARGVPGDGSITCHDSSTAGNINAPQPGGMPGDLSSHGVHNLAGNVAEWVADDLEFFDGSCWQYTTFPLHDPLCKTGSDDPKREKSTRGGWWNASLYKARSVMRESGAYSVPNPVTGVRCAKSWPAAK